MTDTVEPLWSPKPNDPTVRRPGEKEEDYTHRRFDQLRQLLAEHRPPGRAT